MNDFFTDKEFTAYTNGLDRGWKKRGDLSRIEEFAAIRRAAEVAREFDERGIFDPELWITADAIRRAIRAAIGSEKS